MLLTGDTGRGAIGPLKKAFMEPKTVFQTTLGTPIAIPVGNVYTVEPQVTYTVTEADLLAYSPQPKTMHNNMLFVMSGQNLSGVTQGMNYKSTLNAGPAYAGGTQTVANNNYWTYASYTYPDLKVGDQINFFFYAANAGWVITFTGLALYPSQVNFGSKIAVDVAYGLYNPPNPFTIGSAGASFAFRVYGLGTPRSSSNTEYMQPATGEFTVPVMDFSYAGLGKTHASAINGIGATYFVTTAAASAHPVSPLLRHVWDISYRDIIL